MNGFVMCGVVDSTSAEAQRMIIAKHRAPFAVMATMQTAGRGRRGRVWSSIPGNLMMTVVLPPELWAIKPELEATPLKSAILTARFIQERFGVRVTLKWPNDLLFGGRKLGGILCECSSTGAKFGDLLIGIGLNIAAAPHLAAADDADDADDVGTTCLEEILGRHQSRLPELSAIGRELAAWIIDHWNTLDPEHLPDDFAAYAMEEGNIFINEGAVASLKGVDITGALLLDRHIESRGGLHQEGSPIRLTSVDQSWRWIYMDVDAQSGKRPPLMVADVGNSRIKVATWESASDSVPTYFGSFSQDELAAQDWSAVVRAWPRHGKGIPVTCHAVSVSAKNLKALTRFAESVGIRVKIVPKRPLMLRSKYAWNEIGADRVAAMEGFLAGIDHSARGADDAIGVVVCAGTAMTIDAVTFDGRHLGGVIIPGLTTALHALHDAAPALPDLAGDAVRIASAEVMALTTHEAILGGELAMIVGAIQVFVDAARGHLNQKILVVFTGGHAQTVMLGFKKLTTLECELLVKEHLIMDGSRAMVLGGIHGE